jgi:hypothetical protein
MDTVLDRPLTTESFLAWEDRQEARYEFDGHHVILMTGDSIAHQRIIANIWLALLGLLRAKPLMACIMFQRELGGRWNASAHTSGELILPGTDVVLQLADLYEGLSFPTEISQQRH